MIAPRAQSFLTSFYECGIAFGTPYLNLAFASWDAYLLLAGRAAVDVVGLALGKLVLCLCEPAAEFIGFGKIRLVFRRPFVNVPRENAEVCVKNKRPCQKR